MSVRNTALENNSLEVRNNSQDFQENDVIKVAVFTSLSLLSFSIVSINCFVLYLVYSRRSLRTTTNICLASLSCSDLLAGLCAIPLVFSCSLQKTHFNGVCLAMDLFNKFQAISTVLHLLIISLERYVTIVSPLRRSNTGMTVTKNVITTLTTLWLGSALLALIQIPWIDLSFNSPPNPQSQIIYGLCLCVLVSVALLAISFIYFRIFYTLKKQNRHIKRNTPRLEQTTNIRKKSKQKEMRSAVILSSMTITFITGWCFYFVLSLEADLNLSLTIPMWFENTSVFMRFLPAMVNPLLYTFLKQDFIEAVSTIFSKSKARAQPLRERTSLRPTSN